MPLSPLWSYIYPSEYHSHGSCPYNGSEQNSAFWFYFYAPPFERTQIWKHWVLAQETHLDVLPWCAHNCTTANLQNTNRLKIYFACVCTLCGGFSLKRVWAGLPNQFNTAKRHVNYIRGTHFKAETLLSHFYPFYTWNVKLLCEFLKTSLSIWHCHVYVIVCPPQDSDFVLIILELGF